MHRIERYLIEQVPTGLVIRMRQGKQALTCGLISLAILIVSWWFSPHGPKPANFWAPPDSFFLIWCSFFGIVFLCCIIGFFYREDVTITGQDMTFSRCMGLWRREFHRPPPRKLHIHVLPMGTSTGRAIFPFQLFFVDGEGRVSEFCVEFQTSGSVDRFLHAVKPALALEVEDTRKDLWQGCGVIKHGNCSVGAR